MDYIPPIMPCITITKKKQIMLMLIKSLFLNNTKKVVKIKKWEKGSYLYFEF